MPIAQLDPETTRQLEMAHPQDILCWALQEYGARLAIVTSLQPTGIITLHMLRDHAHDLNVLTLDTGLLFAETVAFIDQVERHFGLQIQRVKPAQTPDEQAREHGDALWLRDADQCCKLRKVQPLAQALNGYAAWVTGVRRDHSPARANTPVITWDARYNMVKLCPFAAWTHDVVWQYIHTHNLPYNPLHDRSYPSIGCLPCTEPVNEGDAQRAGRWSHLSKTECGIHQPNPKTG